LNKINILIINFIATLNQIIKESLPPDVRASKETIDLICFIANTFIDLLSDLSNNVCYNQKKKNIVPEHIVRAL
jgi:histone H3/H4